MIFLLKRVFFPFEEATDIFLNRDTPFLIFLVNLVNNLVRIRNCIKCVAFKTIGKLNITKINCAF